jgi:hypothetical protein
MDVFVKTSRSSFSRDALQNLITIAAEAAPAKIDAR